MRAEQKAKGNTHYNICAKDTEEAKATLKAVADASVNDEALFSTFADFLADDFLREVVVSASAIRGRVGFLAEIAERLLESWRKPQPPTRCWWMLCSIWLWGTC